MILADKIMQLRKKNGWSQEELAEKLSVSRQAVSKWEGAQATPDLSKLLAMSQLFGVTTDYLLKDDMEAEEYAQDAEEDSSLRHVTLQQASDFLSWRKQAALMIAGGVMLCMAGVILLLGMIALSRVPSIAMTEEAAVALGLGALFVCVAAAVILFVYCGRKNAPYAFLDEEPFIAEYGVEGLAQKEKQDGQKQHTQYLCVGVTLCILSPLPLILGVLVTKADPVALVCVLLLLCTMGVGLLTCTGVRRGAVNKLLQTGDYSPRGKQRRKLTGPVATIYWLLVTAIFLAWGFAGNGWNLSWIVWPVAGVLFGLVMVLVNALADRNNA